MAIQQGMPLQSGVNGMGLNHLYGYANQNPISNFDPFGLRCWTDTFGQTVCDSGNPFPPKFDPTGYSVALPASHNSNAPKSCEQKCTEGYIGGWASGFALGATYTAAGGPLGFAYAAGSLGVLGSTASYGACMHECKNSCQAP